MPIRLVQNVNLAQFTTFKLGGEALYFVEATHDSDVVAAIDYAKSISLELFVLGGGSNLVVSDSGIAGLVLRMATRGIFVVDSHGPNETLRANAGVGWDEFVAFAVDRELAGIECLSGIPGSVGATPIQNVGAYGQDVGQTLVRVTAYDRVEARQVTFQRDDCELSYRHSRFKTADVGRYVILSVDFELQRELPARPRHPELGEWLSEQAATSVRSVRDAVIKLRAQKCMLETGDAEAQRCAGSFFVNPIVSADEAQQLIARHGNAVPTYPMPDGRTKLAAAWLIEHSGFHRGVRVGNVGLSPYHCLVLVAHDLASASEVVSFAGRIRTEVFSRFGIVLEPEPSFWGFGATERGLPAPTPKQDPRAQAARCG